MNIISKNKFRVVAVDESDYVIDVSQHWWGCVCGIAIWIFPLQGYCVSRDKITYKKDGGIKQVLIVLLAIIMLFSLIVISSVIEAVSVELSNGIKTIFCICVFILLSACKFISSRMQQKKFEMNNYGIEKKSVKLKIHFKNIFSVIKILLLNWFVQLLFTWSIVIGFIFPSGTEGLLPFVPMAIAWFVFGGEIIKIPFTRKDIKYIKILEDKKC